MEKGPDRLLFCDVQNLHAMYRIRSGVEVRFVSPEFSVNLTIRVGPERLTAKMGEIKTL